MYCRESIARQCDRQGNNKAAAVELNRPIEGHCSDHCSSSKRVTITTRGLSERSVRITTVLKARKSFDIQMSGFKTPESGVAQVLSPPGLSTNPPNRVLLHNPESGLTPLPELCVGPSTPVPQFGGAGMSNKVPT